MISQDEFLKKYNIDPKLFAETGLRWPDFEAIYSDYEKKYSDLIATGNLVSEHLRQIKEVHSLKMRIKEPEHLIEKIIRKKQKEPEREVTIENYDLEITDLIGVRALHLFKEDWVDIHKAILDIWPNHQPPVANIRKGDPETLFTENGCEIVEHIAGYRSVHYTVKSQPTKKVFIVEIQVRTIFEEGWSEIDHRLRYPYEVENPILCDYLGILNRFAGGADEMGSFIRRLKDELKQRESTYRREIDTYEQEKARMIHDLESVKKELDAQSKERKKLQKTIDSLQSSKPPTAPSDSLAALGALATFSSTQKCEHCGQMYNALTGFCMTCAATGMLRGMSARKCKQCGQSLGITASASGLCFRCDSANVLGFGLQNQRQCKRCGKSYVTNLFTVDQGVCDICRATTV